MKIKRVKEIGFSLFETFTFATKIIDMNSITSFIGTLLLVLFSSLSFGQSCNCVENFNWMVKTFEENDAGFQYVLDKKGKDYYEDYKKRLTAKLNDTLTPKTCMKLMGEYTSFFRGGHIQVGWNRSFTEFAEQTVKKATSKLFGKNYSEKEILKIIGKKKKSHFLEGIWLFPEWNTKFGVLQNENNPNNFSFYKLAYDVDFENIDIIFDVDYDSTQKSYLLNNLYHLIKGDKLTLDTLRNTLSYYRKGIEHFFVKLPDNTNVTQTLSSTYNFFTNTKPYFEKLTPQTLYLRIPSFRYENKVIIDSILKQNEALIKSVPNLIIDIRNGTGGSDDSYGGLIPFIQTNTTYSTGQQYYATELNSKGYEFYANMIQDSLSKRFCTEIAKKMRDNLGKMIDVDYSEFFVQDTITKLELIKSEYPKQVAIICNKNNGSTDEAFLMEARQSKKVKIFGCTTGGMLDISNLNCINSPDGNLNFCYGMTKSYRIPNFCIDDVGVQPDIYFQGLVPEVEWVDEVVKYLEN